MTLVERLKTEHGSVGDYKWEAQIWRSDRASGSFVCGYNIYKIISIGPFKFGKTEVYESRWDKNRKRTTKDAKKQFSRAVESARERAEQFQNDRENLR